MGENGRIKSNLLQELGFRECVGQDKAFLDVLKKIPILAKIDTTVLICGETGVGKEICARALHYLSKRSVSPFIPVNCGGLSANLIENELFGHKGGAFTDARKNQIGLVAEAQSGTLFLDEIEALSLPAQSSLLRLLQEKTYRPLGQSKQTTADVRFLAATNTNLKQLVQKGEFRSDLYYRFAIPLTIPPLRHRRQSKMWITFFCSLLFFIWFLRFLFSIRIAKKNANRTNLAIASQLTGKV